MAIRQIPNKQKQQVCAGTRDALNLAQAAIAEACRLVDAAADEMMRNGDGDLKGAQDAWAMMMHARRELNA